MRVSEITGMEGTVMSMQDLFVFKQTGLDENRRTRGYFCSTGIRPHCLERLENVGVHVSPELFEQRVLNGEAGQFS